MQVADYKHKCCKKCTHPSQSTVIKAVLNLKNSNKWDGKYEREAN